MQLLAGAVQRDTDHEGGNAEHVRDFAVRMPFDEPQREHFGGAAAEGGDGEAENFAEVALVGSVDVLVRFGRAFERNVSVRACVRAGSARR